MKRQEISKTEIFSVMSVPKAITTLALPTIISQLINLIYNMADTIYIGRTGDAYKTAAVTVAFTIFMMTVAFANLFGIGGGSLIARMIGEGRSDNAKKVCAFSFYGAISIGLLYSILIAAFLEPLLYLLGASSQTIVFAKQYVWPVVIIGSVPVVLSMACAHLLRNTGYSRQASIGLSGGGILNIILDPIFMFVLLPEGMEVLGAAVATLISNVCSVLYLAWTMQRLSKTAPLSIRLRDALQVEKQEIKGVFSVGVPSAILTGLFDVANVFLNALMSVYGDLQLAAIGIVMKAERLPNAINLGLCQGMMPIVAYNYSANNEKRMNETIRTARKYGLITSIACLAIFAVFADLVVRVFMSTSTGNIENSVATVAFAAIFLRIRSLASPVQFLNFHSSYCLQAVGDGRGTLLHACVRQLVFYIPLMFLLNAIFGLYGLVVAIILGEGLSAIFALFLLHRWKAMNQLQG